LDVMEEREWRRMEAKSFKEGFREGHAAGNEHAAQKGFDAGYKIAFGVSKQYNISRGQIAVRSFLKLGNDKDKSVIKGHRGHNEQTSDNSSSDNVGIQPNSGTADSASSDYEIISDISVEHESGGEVKISQLPTKREHVDGEEDDNAQLVLSEKRVLEYIYTARQLPFYSEEEHEGPDHWIARAGEAQIFNRIKHK